METTVIAARIVIGSVFWATFSASVDVLAAFAFCRLTGYRFPASDCDAYSYRTFDCGIMFGMTTEDIRKFFQMMIEKKGRFADVAEECLRHQKDTD